MGERKGWVVTTLPSGRHLARVKVPKVKGKYRSQAFAKKG